MARNPRRGSTLDSFLAQEGILSLPRIRPTRRAMKTADLGAEEIEALRAADFGHIDSELDKLMD